MSIIIGLLGIGLVIFLHELGHLFAAKMSGVTVEAFSVGWGRKIWSFTRGGTEYRISWLPIGGYCKMQGEHALLRAWSNRLSKIEVEDGDFYAAIPWKRIWILIAGPLVNLLFAGVVMTVIAWAGYTYQTFENRVVLVSDVSNIEYPADRAGLLTGDYITAVDDQPITSFHDLQTLIGTRAQQKTSISYERNGIFYTSEITPDLDTSTGAGRIGVYPWVDPVIEKVEEGSAASIAGLRSDDRIVAVNGISTPHTIRIHTLLSEAGTALDFTVERDGTTQTIRVIPGENEEGEIYVGIVYRMVEASTPDYSLPQAVIAGISEAYRTLALTASSLRLLFSGVDLNQAVMGPVRITVLAGEIASQGFRAGIGSGLLAFFNFLSLISIALCFMNLLPIPALDGGQIILSLSEWIQRRPLRPKFVYRYQVIGNVLILSLMLFALFNDILFFARG